MRTVYVTAVLLLILAIIFLPEPIAQSMTRPDVDPYRNRLAAEKRQQEKACQAPARRVRAAPKSIAK